MYANVYAFLVYKDRGSYACVSIATIVVTDAIEVARRDFAIRDIHKMQRRARRRLIELAALDLAERIGCA
jgi:hypothetical protein